MGGMKGGLYDTLGEGGGMERRCEELKEDCIAQWVREVGWREGGMNKRRPV